MNIANICSVITATGSYMPTKIIPNNHFLNNIFYGPDGKKFGESAAEIIEKFREITGIKERRYITDDLVTSDIAYFAAKNALGSSGIDPESLDCVIVAHNFGDVKTDNKKSDMVPNLACRIKHRLGIKSHKTAAYDILFGCPGWLQGVILADYSIKSSNAKRIMVIGAESLSRVADPHDRDSMIYADGAGAVVIERIDCEENIGILSHAQRSDTVNQAYLLQMGRSYNPDYKGGELFLKMDGRKVYVYALSAVPGIVKESLEKAKVDLDSVKKILIHQANTKMDDAILKKVYGLYGITEIPLNVMPMTISWLGNSSVATIPTLLDLLCKGKIENHSLNSGDLVIFASVGAGMNANSLVYKMP